MNKMLMGQNQRGGKVAATSQIIFPDSIPAAGTTLEAGEKVYTFTSGAGHGDDIDTSSALSPSDLVRMVADLINRDTSQTLCTAVWDSVLTIDFVANTPGLEGDSIPLGTTVAGATLTPFHGGAG
jgi:hypothetical protein